MKNNHKNVIDNCGYIQNSYTHSNNKDEYCSLAYLLKDLTLMQSDKIKLGHALEVFLNDYIKLNKSWVRIDYSTSLLHCQIDELLMNKHNKTIIYSEYKSNIALDSQKRKVMFKHCNELFDRLKELYPDYSITGYIVNLRFLYNADIPPNILNRFKNQGNIKILGLNEYLELLNLDTFDDYSEYTSFLKYTCSQNFMKKT